MTVPFEIESDTCQDQCVAKCVCRYRNQLLMQWHIAAKWPVVGLVPEALTIGIEVFMIELGYTSLTCTQVGSSVLQTGTTVRARPAVAARRLSYFWEKGIVKDSVTYLEKNGCWFSDLTVIKNVFTFIKALVRHLIGLSYPPNWQ